MQIYTGGINRVTADGVGCPLTISGINFTDHLVFVWPYLQARDAPVECKKPPPTIIGVSFGTEFGDMTISVPWDGTDKVVDAELGALFSPTPTATAPGPQSLPSTGDASAGGSRTIAVAMMLLAVGLLVSSLGIIKRS